MLRKLLDLKNDKQGSAYAFAMLFISCWCFAMVYYFFISPLHDYIIKTYHPYSIEETFSDITLFRTMFSIIVIILPLFAFLYLTIGWLKYSHEVAERR